MDALDIVRAPQSAAGPRQHDFCVWGIPGGQHRCYRELAASYAPDLHLKASPRERRSDLEQILKNNIASVSGRSDLLCAHRLGATYRLDLASIVTRLPRR